YASAPRAHGKVSASEPRQQDAAASPDGMIVVSAPMQGTIIGVDVDEGATIHAGQPLLLMEAMKMEHVVVAPTGGIVRQLLVTVGDTVYEGAPLAYLEETAVSTSATGAGETVDLDEIRPDLAEALQRQGLPRDAARPDAVDRPRAPGQPPPRENIDDLCDPGSFIEYGSLAIAAQRRRRTVQDLIERTPADGLVAGIGRVNGDLVGDAHARGAVRAA